MAVSHRIGQFLLNRPELVPVFVALGVIALPIAVWLDLTAISDQALKRQGHTLDSLMTTVRSYYAQNVISQLDGETPTKARHDHHEVEGAIPIPATLSIEIGQAIDAKGLDATYRFLSDLPFEGRDRPPLSTAESNALAQFRNGIKDDALFFAAEGNNLFQHRLTMLTPVRMGAACVACHNSHPDSPKTDWQVGDVRGLQSFTIGQPVAVNLLSFSHLLGYLIVAGSVGTIFALHQLRLARQFKTQSEELASNNEFLAGVSMKISRYLSPQVYKSIFSGEKTAEISTERKKLTVFFTDIKDFTQTSEDLQPEELTELLNEYFTEMSAIAERHGATIDKFIGDAIVGFFGDPETRGTAEDARACVAMALEMQDRLEELDVDWRKRGIDRPFRARIGINTGFCNVGNFGSSERMDYTIIGAEANLAARLEAAAEPGGIVMSYETYAHVRDMVAAEAMPPMQFKGISREIIPYAIHPGRRDVPTSELSPDGKSMTVHLERLDQTTRAQLERLLHASATGLRES